MERRKFSASVAIDETSLWITGGYNAFNNKKSTEFVSLNKSPLKGPDLPFTIWVRFELSEDFFPQFFFPYLKIFFYRLESSYVTRTLFNFFPKCSRFA